MGDLLDLAMQRFTEIASSLGFPSSQRDAVPQVNLEAFLMETKLEPLMVPGDAVRWWTSWDIEDLAFLHDDYFIAHPPLTALAQRQFIIDLEHPHVLLPIMKEEKRELALELMMAGSPGGRIFEIDFHGGEIRLIGSNLADLVDLLSDTLERSAGRTADHERLISWETYADLVDQRHTALGRVTIDPSSRASWPTSWLHAARPNDDGVGLKEATHSVAEFDEIRRTRATIGVLHGNWQTSVKVSRGMLGTLTDPTGSITIFVPDDALQIGFGPYGACQIEVASRGTPTPAQSATDGSAQDQTRGQTDELDGSVVAAAIWPISTVG